MLDEAGEPELAAAMGDGDFKPLHSKSIVPQSVIDQIVATGVPLVVENIANHSLFTRSAYLMLSTPRTMVSFIGVPVKADGKVRGVLTVDREWDGRLQFRLDDDVRLLTMVADLIGQAIRMHALVARDRGRLILETHRLEKELSEVREALPTPAPHPKATHHAGIIGSSPVIRRCSTASKPSRAPTPPFCCAAKRNGKELFAHAIHQGFAAAQGAVRQGQLRRASRSRAIEFGKKIGSIDLLPILVKYLP